MSRRNFEAVVMDTVYAVIHVKYVFIAHILIHIGCATLYHLSMMYVTVYNMSFNSNCRILAAELNYRFTLFSLNRCIFYALLESEIRSLAVFSEL